MQMNLQKVFPKWEVEDQVCPGCNQITKRERGITRQNLKRLIKPQWNTTEWIINILLIGFILMGLLYGNETSQARNFVKLLKEDPKTTCDALMDCKINPDYINCKTNCSESGICLSTSFVQNGGLIPKINDSLENQFSIKNKNLVVGN